MRNERYRLKRTLGRVEVFALAFGTMIGWGWIILPAEWINSAGVFGSIIAFLIGGLMCIFVGLTYAELTSAFPLAGGELAFSYRGIGYLGSWVTGWTISYAYIGVAAWEGIALSSAMHYMFPLNHFGYLWSIAGFDVYFSWSMIGITGALILTSLHIIGVKPVAVFQILLVMVMLLAGILFLLGSVAFGDTKNMSPTLTNVKGVGMVLLMAPSMYIGFDMVSKSAEEMNMPLKDIAKVLIVSIVGACSWYVFMILGTALSLPPFFRPQVMIPTADSAALTFESEAMAKVMIVGGICGIITSWNGFLIGASRILFAMGRARMLPGMFGWVHPKYKTPVVSIIFVGLICCFSPLLGENALIWLIDTSAFGAVIVYLLISISFLKIRKKEPELKRKYTIKRAKTVGILAIIIASFFLFWYTPLSPSALHWPYEWMLIIAWVLIGMLMLLFSYITDKKKEISLAEREMLMFGEEYVREIYDTDQVDGPEKT